MKYWNYINEIKNGIILDINETYVVIDDGKSVIFRLNITGDSDFFDFISDTKIRLKKHFIEKAIYISDMNNFRDKNDDIFNYGEVNTYPWQLNFNSGISLDSRSWRIATSNEKEILNKSIIMKRPLKINELRNLKLEEIGIV